MAKYFAIIPAAFATTYPALDALNVMHLASPESAILSAVIFNALIIIALVPLALRGVKTRAASAALLLRRNLLIYGLGGMIVPFVGHQDDRHVARCPRRRLREFTMLRELRPALIVFLLLTVLTGLVYPGIVTLIGRVAFPDKVSGSIIERDGKAVGSRLLGQGFSSPGYFWSRPSATGPQGYNGAVSSGSNQGPVNPALENAVRDRVAALHAADPDNKAAVPVDLVTASGSGLDPEISIAAAEYQLARVARVRGLDETRVRELVHAATRGRTFGVLGEPGVNVLELNLALDAGP